MVDGPVCPSKYGSVDVSRRNWVPLHMDKGVDIARNSVQMSLCKRTDYEGVLRLMTFMRRRMGCLQPKFKKG
ncbi:hypothetical protein F511_28941 [Dorcoceras hygrometricum]|uniref:Uncharacterized protein n=1 Tax=Dorcoceras hygrometricum TaxID=472368 RepID=A0A2Z7C3W0_9LAMI|nr:hypothetical protein F511_28941 [Dorcoceras hygrometricum]